MFHTLSQIDQMRWLAFRNDSGETIPPYGVMRITGAAKDDTTGVVYLTVAKPNATAEKSYLINGPTQVTSGKYGSGTFEPAMALYDTSDSTPVLGAIWGPKSGQWTLDITGTGYTILGSAIVDASPRVFVRRYVTAANNPPIRFQLQSTKLYGVTGSAKLVTWGGAAYAAGGAAFDVIDPFAVWPRAEVGWYGWAIPMDDRGKYEILWCQGWPRFLDVSLYENMGATTARLADSIVIDAYGSADHGGQPDTFLQGEHVTVYDGRNRWPWAKQLDRAYCIYNEEDHIYEIVDLPETTGYGFANANSTPQVVPPFDFEKLVWDTPHQMKGCTFVGPRERWVIGIAGIWEVHASATIKLTTGYSGNQAGGIAVAHYRAGAVIAGGLSGEIAFLGNTSSSQISRASFGVAAFGIFNCQEGDEITVHGSVSDAESAGLTFNTGSFTIHLIEPSSTGRAAPPVAPLVAQLQRNNADLSAAFTPDPSFFDA